MPQSPFRVRVLIDKPHQPNSLKLIKSVSCPRCNSAWFDDGLVSGTTAVLRCNDCHDFIEIEVNLIDSPQPPQEFLEG